MESLSSEEFDKHWSNHKVTTLETEHFWEIDQFQDKFSAGNIESPKFSADGHDIQFQFKLQSFLFSFNEKSICISYYCFFGKEVFSEVLVNFEVYLMKNFYQRDFIKRDFHVFADDLEAFQNNLISLNYVVKHMTNNRFYGNDLRLCVKVSGRYVKATKFVLRQMAFLDSGKFSDFTIVVGDSKIPVHKNILSAHSPIFEAMFNHNNTKEAQEHKMEVTDVFPNVMKNFLLFIYTGQKPKKVCFSTELLAVANKYQVDDLKSFCEDCLSENISVENAVNYLQIADLHSANTLKARCLTFITSNFSQVVQTEAWEQLCNDKSEIVEVTRAVGNILASQKK